MMTLKEIRNEFNKYGISDHQIYGEANIIGEVFGLKVREYSLFYGIQEMSISESGRCYIEYKKNDWDWTYVVMFNDDNSPISTHRYKGREERIATEDEKAKIIAYLEGMINDKKAYIDSISDFTFDVFAKKALEYATEECKNYKNLTCRISYGKSQVDSHSSNAIVIEMNGNQCGYIKLIDGVYNQHHIETCTFGIRNKREISPSNLNDNIKDAIYFIMH